MSTVLTRFAAMALLSTLFACGGGGGDDPNNGWTCVGGCPSEGVVAVDNEERADRLASAIANAATLSVPAGTSTNRVVNGLSGTATYNGHANSTSGSCGTDCVSRKQDVDVTVTYANYRVQVGSDEVTLNGTARVRDNTGNRTTASGSTSTGSVRVDATDLQARHVIGGTWGEADTVTLVVSSTTGANWSGSLRGANQVSWSF